MKLVVNSFFVIGVIVFAHFASSLQIQSLECARSLPTQSYREKSTRLFGGFEERGLRLRGGSETGTEQANEATSGYADPASYQQASQTTYNTATYETSQASGWPTAQSATYAEPTYQPAYQAPAAPSHSFVPPAAPSAYQAQPQYVPSAPAAYAAPIGYAPAPPKAVWDQSSLSFTRRFIDLFGWENISPIFYLVLGLSVSTIRAILANGGDDDEFQLMTDPSPR